MLPIWIGRRPFGRLRQKVRKRTMKIIVRKRTMKIIRKRTMKIILTIGCQELNMRATDPTAPQDTLVVLRCPRRAFSFREGRGIYV